MNRVKSESMPMSDLMKELRRRLGRTKKRIALVVAIGMGAAFYANYFNTKLTFVCQHTGENKKIIESVKPLRIGEYKPTMWLPFGWMQVIYGAKFDASPYVRSTHEFIKAADGGTIMLDWGEPHEYYTAHYTPEQVEKMNICVVSHGISWGSSCNYIRYPFPSLTHWRRSLMETGRKAGFRVVVVNRRGFDVNVLTVKDNIGGL
jgi:hypothetical protein